MACEYIHGRGFVILVFVFLFISFGCGLTFYLFIYLNLFFLFLVLYREKSSVYFIVESLQFHRKSLSCHYLT